MKVKINLPHNARNFNHISPSDGNIYITDGETYTVINDVDNGESQYYRLLINDTYKVSALIYKKWCDVIQPFNIELPEDLFE